MGMLAVSWLREKPATRDPLPTTLVRRHGIDSRVNTWRQSTYRFNMTTEMGLAAH